MKDGVLGAPGVAADQLAAPVQSLATGIAVVMAAGNPHNLSIVLATNARVVSILFCNKLLKNHFG